MRLILQIGVVWLALEALAWWAQTRSGWTAEIMLAPFTQQWLLFPLLPRYTVNEYDTGDENGEVIYCYRDRGLWGQVLCLHYRVHLKTTLWSMTRAQWAEIDRNRPRKEMG